MNFRQTKVTGSKEIRWLSDSDDDLIHIHVNKTTCKQDENQKPLNIMNQDKLVKKSEIKPLRQPNQTPVSNNQQKTSQTKLTKKENKIQRITSEEEKETRDKVASKAKQKTEEIHDVAEFGSYEKTYISLKQIYEENLKRKAKKVQKFKYLQKEHETQLHDLEVKNNDLIVTLQNTRFEMEQKVQDATKRLAMKEKQKAEDEKYCKTLEIKDKIKAEKESFEVVSTSVRTLAKAVSNNIIHEDDFKSIYDSNPFKGEVGEKYKELVDSLKECFLSKNQDNMKFMNEFDSIPLNF